VKAICVDPQRIMQVWPLVKDLVKQAIDRGFSDFSAIEANVLDGMHLVWLAYDGKIRGVAVTGLVGDACEIIAASGTGVGSWLHLRIIGRQGWKRLLPDYKQQAVVLERKL
jgi:hypothetical protein